MEDAHLLADTTFLNVVLMMMIIKATKLNATCRSDHVRQNRRLHKHETKLD
jgi:hypothetical protein